ncbi:unnamed protein product, partial [Gadus morhua 'NCC']
MHSDLLFGNATTLDVKFRDDTPHVAPTLSILRPMLGDMEGPQVCLATGFYPDISNRVLLNPLKDITNQLLISPRSKSYTYATFSKGSIISSCSVEGADNEAVPTNANPTTAYLTTRSTPVTVNTTSAHKLENHTEVFNAEPSDNNRLSSYYLLINGLRHILTKTLVLNVLVVLRGPRSQ